MAKRTTQLTELTVVAQDDYIPIVDTSAGDTKRVSVKNLTGAPDLGWTATGESWTFSSWNATTSVGVITVPTDATTKYSIDMLVRIVQTTGGTKWGRILSLTATTLTVWMPDQTLNNEAITSPVYSPLAAPFGAPAGLQAAVPYKFSVRRTSAQTPNGTVILFNTEDLDTNDNYNTSNGRFTAPVTGVYQFNVYANWLVTAASQDPLVSVRKNGVLLALNPHFVNMYSGISSGAASVAALLPLVAGDYIDITGPNLAIETTGNMFSGFLVSRL